MFTQAELDRLIDAMRANAVTLLEVTGPDAELKLGLSAAADIAPRAPKAPRRIAAHSPCIGRFVPRGAQDGLSPLGACANVQAGDTLGYIAQRQALALVVAPADGTLVADMPPPEGTVFGYGDVVFELEATS